MFITNISKFQIYSQQKSFDLYTINRKNEQIERNQRENK
jgi:hypothetical protein